MSFKADSHFVDAMNAIDLRRIQQELFQVEPQVKILYLLATYEAKQLDQAKFETLRNKT